MKRNLFLVMALCASVYSFGQGEVDALRYSRNDLTGTARGQAMGGAFGALGGDVSSVAINPAGLGVYHSSEIVANMNFTSTSIETNWNNAISKQDKFKFNFDNLAYMGYFPTGSDVIKSVNFGFSYNRLKNLDRTYSSSGKGMTSSLTDYIANISNGVNYKDMDYGFVKDPFNSNAPWLSVLSWNGGIIDSDGSPTEYKGLFSGDDQHDGIAPTSKLSVAEKGRIESYDFSVGTNFSEKFFLGVSFSLTDLFYSLESRYTEDFQNQGGYDLDNKQETDGSGYQVKVGAIFRPTDALRLGIAYHSPTWYNMKNYAQGTLGSDFANQTIYTPNDYWNNGEEYKLRTPYSWVFSAAGVIGTKAIVSLDYELKDYTSMNLADSYGYNFDYNQYIDQDFRMTSTVRAGLEYRVTPQLSARLGYAWMQNPYQTTFRDAKVAPALPPLVTIPHYTIEGDASYVTCGLGYKFTPNFYADVAFVWRSQTDDLYYYPKLYDGQSLAVDSTPAQLKNNTYKGMLTLGYKF